jgi:hypothetical protein
MKNSPMTTQHGEQPEPAAPASNGPGLLVGLVSNTAGRADLMSSAAEVLHTCGAQVVLHCGDVGGRHVLDALVGSASAGQQPAEYAAAFVWGDRDRDRMGLLRYARKLGVACYGILADLELGGKRIAMIHGDDRRMLNRLIQEQQHAYVLCGHDASAEDRRTGRARIINPGSLYGSARRTVAVLDLDTDELRTIEF